jgi:uncharacterized membrane protein
MMTWENVHNAIILIQHLVSSIGVFIIIVGVFYALCQYIYSIFKGPFSAQPSAINYIRLQLGHVLILGLEFIVAADLIGTTTTPDYYAVGLLAIIVLIRTVLSFSINRELIAITKETQN